MSLDSDRFACGRVVFRKQVSDGNYGTEAAEISLEIDVDDIGDEEAENVVAATLATARRLVHAELQQSPSPGVRRAVEYPKPEAIRVPVSTDDDDEDLPY